MRYIGEFTSDTELSLGIEIKGYNGGTIELDNPVEVAIESRNETSPIVVENVILDLIKDTGEYQKRYKLSDLDEGLYHVIYKVSIDDEVLEKLESFRVIESINKDDFQDEELENDYANQPQFTLSSNFQEVSTIEVEGKEVILTLAEDLMPNHLYTLYIKKGISSKKSSIEKDYSISFSSEYSPLYSTPLEVKSLLKDIYFYFSESDIYEAIRDSGQKAHQMQRILADPSAARFQMIRERDDNYFPTMRYVTYQSAIQILNQLIIKLIYADSSSTSESGSNINHLDFGGMGFSLGDFEVTGAREKEDSGFGDKIPVEVSVLQRMIRAFTNELKFWESAMMGYNARGYGRMTSATNRGGVASPESRDL